MLVHQVFVIWGLTFAAALLTLALRNIPRRTKAVSAADDDANTPLLKSRKELPAPCSMVGTCAHVSPFQMLPTLLPESASTG